MIREQDLLEAIAECQGQKNPNANTCIKLAAFYTILDHIKEKDETEEAQRDVAPVYSYSPGDLDSGLIQWQSESEFGNIIHNLPAEDVWPIMDELMSTVKVLYPKLYNAVMNKLDGL